MSKHEMLPYDHPHRLLLPPVAPALPPLSLLFYTIRSSVLILTETQRLFPARWLTVIGGALVSMCTVGNAQSFGVYQDYYTRISLVEMSPSQISWIGSVQLFLMFGLGIISGKLFDAGYFRSSMLFGGGLFITSLFMLSLVQPHHYYQNLLAQGFGMGLGMGMMLLPSTSVVSHYFRKRRSLAMGLVITGKRGVGSVIYPIILNKFFGDERLGFAWGTRLLAFIDLVLLILANVLMKMRRKYNLPSPFPPQGSSFAQSTTGVLRDVPFWLSAVGMFFIWWGVFIPYFYLQLFSKINGIDASFSAWAITILNAAATFGRFLPNFLADRYGTLNVFIPSAFLSGALLWALLSVRNTAGVVVFASFYGFFSGALFSLVFPAVATFGTMNDIGLRIGFTALFMSVAALTGSPLAGALLAAPDYVWWRPLVFGCACIMIGGVCNLFARQAMTRRKGTVFV
ncbi:MFS general substrate transporter [Hymenopellis radicata]|nr:MFS general substrate transporter [Hymenopellis radicata]